MKCSAKLPLGGGEKKKNKEKKSGSWANPQFKVGPSGPSHTLGLYAKNVNNLTPFPKPSF